MIADVQDTSLILKCLLGREITDKDVVRIDDRVGKHEPEMAAVDEPIVERERVARVQCVAPRAARSKNSLTDWR